MWRFVPGTLGSDQEKRQQEAIKYNKLYWCALDRVSGWRKSFTSADLPGATIQKATEKRELLGQGNMETGLTSLGDINVTQQYGEEYLGQRALKGHSSLGS